MSNSKCVFCNMNPSSHSFHELLDIDVSSKKDVRIFYSRPADAELYSNTQSVVHHFECELANVGEWEWVFDCSGMGISHYMQFDLVRELCQVFKRHGGLRHVKILNAGWMINITVRAARLIWPGLPVISIHPGDISI